LKGNLTVGEELRSSGSFNVDGSVSAKDDTKFSGSANISGDLIVDDDLKSSGSLKVGGAVTIDDDAKFRGSAKIEGDTDIGEFLRSSGSLKCASNVKAKQGAKIRGSANIKLNLETEGYVDIKGSAKIGGNVTGVDIIFDQRKWYAFWYYWTFYIFNFWRIFRKAYEIGGCIIAKNTVDINRTNVAGDIKARTITLRRFTKVDGTVYYVDECLVHKKAELVNQPVRIALEEL